MTTFGFLDWSAKARDETAAKIMNTIAANHCELRRKREKKNIEKKSSAEIVEFFFMWPLSFLIGRSFEEDRRPLPS